MPENSPTFQGWVLRPKSSFSPEGTAESLQMVDPRLLGQPRPTLLARGLCRRHKLLRLFRQRFPIVCLKDFARYQRAACAKRGASRFQELGDIVHIHASRRNYAQMRQGGAESFDIARPQRISRKDFDEIRSGFMGS